MAKQLDPSEVNFSLRGSRSPVSDEWFNGEPWMLESGTDFTGKVESFRTYLYALATSKNLSARSKIIDGNLIFSTYTPSPEEQARKAESVAKRQATMAANKAAGKTRKSRKSAEAPAE